MPDERDDKTTQPYPRRTSVPGRNGPRWWEVDDDERPSGPLRAPTFVDEDTGTRWPTEAGHQRCVRWCERFARGIGSWFGALPQATQGLIVLGAFGLAFAVLAGVFRVSVEFGWSGLVVGSAVDQVEQALEDAVDFAEDHAAEPPASEPDTGPGQPTP